VQDGDCRAAVPLAALPAGRWTVTLSFALYSGDREIPVRRPRDLAAVRWRRGLRPFYARPVTSTDALELEIAPVKIAVGIRRRAGKALQRR
jgi:hypothetical protein